MNTEINRLQEEIKEEMTILAPNTSFLIGAMLTARLLVHAGSLEKMAMIPASSIQLRGAEKA
jgi:nucleolar protein 56